MLYDTPVTDTCARRSRDSRVSPLRLLGEIGDRPRRDPSLWHHVFTDQPNRAMIPTSSNDGTPVRLRVGQRVRVNGSLHSYLGTTSLDSIDEPIHVFVREEWRPEPGERSSVTLVEAQDMATSVTPIRQVPA